MTGPPFPAQEYTARLDALQRAMRRHRLDGLLLTEMANFEYVTGFQARVTWTSYTRILAVIVPAAKPPALLVPDFLAAEAGVVSGYRVHVYDRIDRPPMDELRALIVDHLGATGRIGLELAGETRLGAPFEVIRGIGDLLPQATLVDGSEVPLRVRMRKSTDEIERVALACAANTHAFGSVFSKELGGSSEKAVAHELTLAALAAGERWDGWTMPGWVAITSGVGGYDRFLGHPRDRALEDGDIIWSDLGVTVDGYWSDFCRAAVVGGPTERQRERQSRILEATAAGVERARPGARASDVAAAVADGLDRLGLPSFGFGRVGHGIGLTATELPHIASYDETVLEQGMIVTVEPASVADDGLYCAEQVVVVDDPPRVLSMAPGELSSV